MVQCANAVCRSAFANDLNPKRTPFAFVCYWAPYTPFICVVLPTRLTNHPKIHSHRSIPLGPRIEWFGIDQSLYRAHTFTTHNLGLSVSLNQVVRTVVHGHLTSAWVWEFWCKTYTEIYRRWGIIWLVLSSSSSLVSFRFCTMLRSLMMFHKRWHQVCRFKIGINIIIITQIKWDGLIVIMQILLSIYGKPQMCVSMCVWCPVDNMNWHVAIRDGRRRTSTIFVFFTLNDDSTTTADLD